MAAYNALKILDVLSVKGISRSIGQVSSCQTLRKVRVDVGIWFSFFPLKIVMYNGTLTAEVPDVG